MDETEEFVKWVKILYESGELDVSICDKCGLQTLETSSLLNIAKFERLISTRLRNMIKSHRIFTWPDLREIGDAPLDLGFTFHNGINRIIYPNKSRPPEVCSSTCQVELIRQAVDVVDCFRWKDRLGDIFQSIDMSDPAFFATEGLTPVRERSMKKISEMINKLYVTWH